MTLATTRQSPWLARMLRALAGGKTIASLPLCAPWKNPPILLPQGPMQGASVLPLGQGLVVGDGITSAIKGKSLFIPRYHKAFGTGL
jgi:apoptosis-inducing factor 2